MMKNKIKNLRVEIDGLAKLTEELKPLHKYEEGVIYPVKYNSKEIEEAKDSLYLAKAWLGKILGQLNEENPYKPGKKEVNDIESTAEDVTSSDNPYNILNEVEDFWNRLNHIEKVDWIRERIKNAVEQDYNNDIVDEWYDIREYFNDENTVLWYFGFFVKEFGEARFWLGFEFQRLYEQNNK